MFWLNLRTLGLTLASLCAAFWLWFGIASAIGERLGPASGIMHVVLPGGVLLMTILVARKWEGLGGMLLVLEGLAVAIGYPILARGRFPVATVVLMVLTLALPPLVAGFMLVADARRVALRR